MEASRGPFAIIFALALVSSSLWLPRLHPVGGHRGADGASLRHRMRSSFH